jgi:hypothetical protein
MAMRIKTLFFTTVAVAAVTAATLGTSDAAPTASSHRHPITSLVHTLDSNGQNLGLILTMVT